MYCLYIGFVADQVAIAMKSVEDDFLGTQGYVWDTPSDMLYVLYVLIGAIPMLLILSRTHDRQLTTLAGG